MSDNIIINKIAEGLNLPLQAVRKTVELLSEGATVPFISRYRKEVTGSLDEVAIGSILKELNRLQELVKRKAYILAAIEEQGSLSESIKRQIDDCWDSLLLEDIYLPFKKKRKTRATAAKENGLEPLADYIWSQKHHNIIGESKSYLNDKVKTVEDALQGARDILAERINENMRYRGLVRNLFKNEGILASKVIKKKESEAIKYQDYFNYEEPASRAPAHRLLAVFRGEKEGFLRVKLQIDENEACRKLSYKIINSNTSGSCREQLELSIQDAFKRLLAPSIETEFRNIYKEVADDEAILVFVNNLKQLLLAPPLGTKNTMGIDPGFRSGCKVVCLDSNGELLHNTTIYPHPPQLRKAEAENTISKLVEQYQIEAIAIGNGTAGNETYDTIKGIGLSSEIQVFMVNENGASIYSASEIARNEFPDHDLTVRGAVSIARRLMDPLAELVKIDPKSIGVGQYQHDVHQGKLKDNLTECVSFCVNAVGVNLNTASEHLLNYVSGLGPVLSKNIIDFRTEHGSFDKIERLKKVPRMGAKAFEQSAGFLRLRGAKNPLDNTGVHPERYGLVKQMAKDAKSTLDQLIGNEDLIRSIDKKKYISEDVGLPTITDIINELLKPGLDIRGAAKTFEFTPGIKSIDDIKQGMMIKGIVNNVTKFGAFVDLGIKEAGLIHISQLSNSFVKDPMDVIKLNQEVYARVIAVDVNRKRISLSLKE